MIGFALTRIPDPSWGSPKIARAIVRNGDHWGVLAALRNTPWEPLFPEIPSSVFDMALRGRATPLMRILGRPPEALVKQLPSTHTPCKIRKDCVNAAPICIPGRAMPLCWEAEGLEAEAAEIASKVAVFWKEDVHVVVVVPEET